VSLPIWLSESRRTFLDGSLKATRPTPKELYFSLAYFLINEFLSPPAIVLNDLRILDFSAFKMHFRIRLAAPPKGKPPPRNR
jgi:hypothetical protein